MNYFIIVNDAQQGPYTIDELRQRHITQETLVWCEGMANWQPAWQVEELRTLFFNAGNGQATPPPIPGATNVPIPPVNGTSDNAQGTSNGPVNDGPGYGGPVNGGPVNSGPVNGGPVNGDGQNGDKKRKSRKTLYITLGIIAFILFLMALTNPNRAEHQQAILAAMDTTSVESEEDANNPAGRSIMDYVMKVGKTIANEMIREQVMNNLEYHTYVFFSTTTLHSDLVDHDLRTSTGFFGHVKVVSLTSVVPQFFQQMTGFDRDGESMDEQDNGDDNGVQGEETTVETQTVKKNGVTVDSVTKRMTKRLANDVARKVKQEVKQQTDSTTSKDVNGIIDQVLQFIKDLL